MPLGFSSISLLQLQGVQLLVVLQKANFSVLCFTKIEFSMAPFDNSHEQQQFLEAMFFVLCY